ncbi:hypothetical protein BC833DRAFT_572791 [Globomyces pollinis-pini]|nr:hypothetical protein BC833DRAFT_572791 [Globomyces pollinis-pini]
MTTKWQKQPPLNKKLTEFRRLESSAQLLSSFQIPRKSDFVKDGIEKYCSKSYPRQLKKLEAVKHFEEKERIDKIRQFDGLASEQQEVLLRIIDKNGRLRQRAKLPIGIYETIQDEMYDSIYQEKGEGDKTTAPPTILCDEEISEQSFSSDTDDLFDADFPIDEYDITSNPSDEDGDNDVRPLHFGLAKDLTIIGSRFNQEEKRPTLKQLYGHFIDQKKEGELSNVDLEQEAIAAMKMVTADLTSWVVNVLDHSIKLDPVILEQVKDLDEKHGESSVKKQVGVVDNDISGFNVLLNACKPSILESKPAMRLNVVKEMVGSSGGNHIGIQKSSASIVKTTRQKSKNYGAWYLPPENWSQCMLEHTTVDDEPIADSGHHFGGIVQQKLDEIAHKRQLEYDNFKTELDHDVDSNPNNRRRNSDSKKRK